MGNRVAVPVKDGQTSFTVSYHPKALLLVGATRAELMDAADFARWTDDEFVVLTVGKRPSFRFLDKTSVKDLYEANPAMTHRLWKGVDDHSATVWLKRVGEKLHFRALVRDDVHAVGDKVEIILVVDGQTRTVKLDTPVRKGSFDVYETDCPFVDGMGFDLRIHDDDGEGEDSFLFLRKPGDKPLVLR